MEKAISDEEKIRRAIEISQRRNQNYYSRATTRVNVNNDKKDYKLFKKMILQIIICLLIYLIFYLISTTNYVFSEQVLKSATDILSYDINLEKIYKDSQNFFITTFTNSEDNNNESNIINNTVTNNAVNAIINSAEENTLNTNILTNTIVVENKEEEKKDKEQKEENKKEKQDDEDKEEIAMKKDAEKVKKICKFQKPLSGTITSEFGEREVILNGMTSDHKGIDIAANSGTNIKAATAGTVTVAEENSEYGKFIKIQNGEVMTVYAHCKSLKVKKGDKVKSGQKIATVGSTGNSTGPHLHFEIRLSGRYINPRYVINF